MQQEMMWIECAKPGSKGGGECGRWLVRFFYHKDFQVCAKGTEGVIKG